jgi:hypothetical protein
MVLADEDSTAFMPDVWQIPAAMWFDEDKLVDAIRAGTGVAWSEHDRRVHHGVAAFYRNAYRASLVSEWLPALNGVVRPLDEGITVADVGCGFGHSQALKPGGTVMLVEPFAADRVENNISPIARFYYAASTMLCCAHAISEGGQLVLGAQAGQAKLGEVFRAAGFSSFRRAAQTPFNLVLEARL